MNNRFMPAVYTVLWALWAGVPGLAEALPQRGVGVVVAMRGEVAVQHEEAIARREARPVQEPLRFRDDVFFRDLIDTQRESFARLLLRGRSVFTIRELSRVELREGIVPADPSRIRSIVSLLTGAFWAVIERDLRPQDEVEIQTPNAISAVRGTDVVVEVYRDTTAPPLPTASTEATVQAVAFQVAQAPRVVSRWYVRDGEIEVEGLRARPGDGIEKVDNLPARLFRFAPAFIERVVRQLAVEAVEGPQGSHRAALVQSQEDQAQLEVAVGAAPPVPERPVQAIEPAIQATSFVNTLTFKLSGSFTGTLAQQGGVTTPSISGTYLASVRQIPGLILRGTISATANYPTPSTAISGPMSGSISGRVTGWPLTGTMSFGFSTVPFGPPSVATSVTGPLVLQGSAVVSTRPFSGTVIEFLPGPPFLNSGTVTGRVGR